MCIYIYIGIIIIRYLDFYFLDIFNCLRNFFERFLDIRLNSRSFFFSFEYNSLLLWCEF